MAITFTGIAGTYKTQIDAAGKLVDDDQAAFAADPTNSVAMLQTSQDMANKSTLIEGVSTFVNKANDLMAFLIQKL